jgi:hypothetical protein
LRRPQHTAVLGEMAVEEKVPARVSSLRSRGPTPAMEPRESSSSKTRHFSHCTVHKARNLGATLSCADRSTFPLLVAPSEKSVGQTAPASARLARSLSRGQAHIREYVLSIRRLYGVLARSSLHSIGLVHIRRKLRVRLSTQTTRLNALRSARSYGYQRPRGSSWSSCRPEATFRVGGVGGVDRNLAGSACRRSRTLEQREPMRTKTGSP